MGTDNSLCHSIATQLIQIVQRAFGTGQQNDIRLGYFFRIIGVKEVDTRIALQHVEVRKITEMTQHHHGNIHLTLRSLHGFGSKGHAILFFYIDIFIIRYYSQHRNAAKFFKHFHARLKQTQIASEFIDKDTLDTGSFMRPEQHKRTVNTGKHSAPVNVAHQHNFRSGMQSHGQIHQVAVAQIDFRNTSGSFQYNRIVTCCQTIVGCTHFLAQLLTPLLTEIIVSRAVAYRTSVQYHLRRMVTLRLQQQRIHVRVTGNAGSLCLYRLCTAYLKTFGSGIRIERHVLRLEGSGLIAVLPEDTAESSSQNTLAHIASGTYQHKGFQ